MSANQVNKMHEAKTGRAERNWENSSLLLVIVVIVLSIVTDLSTTDSATTIKQQGCSRPEHHYEAPGSKWHI